MKIVSSQTILETWKNDQKGLGKIMAPNLRDQREVDQKTVQVRERQNYSICEEIKSTQRGKLNVRVTGEENEKCQILEDCSSHGVDCK